MANGIFQLSSEVLVVDSNLLNLMTVSKDYLPRSTVDQHSGQQVEMLLISKSSIFLNMNIERSMEGIGETCDGALQYSATQLQAGLFSRV